MKKKIIMVMIFTISCLSEANARFGIHAAKPALAHSPNWVVIIILSIAAIFILSVIREIFDEYKDVTDSEGKRNGFFLKFFSIFGFIACLYVVFDAAFGWLSFLEDGSINEDNTLIEN